MNIFDLHCDTLHQLKNSEYSVIENAGHISETKLLRGEYLAQCFAIYIPVEIKADEAFHYFKEQYDTFKTMLKNSDFLRFARNKNDILLNKEKNTVSCVLTAENAEFLNGNLENLNYLKSINLKIVGLIHNSENCFGFPNSSDKAKDLLPLKPFGREVADALNFTDIYLDVSHLNVGGFNNVTEIYKKPIIATHSACRNIFSHPRNLYDFQIKKIAESGGVVGLVYYSKFLNGGDKSDFSDIIMHLKHLINVGGEEIAALGSDFDGMDCELPFCNCSEIQFLCEKLIKIFGFSIAEKICFKNALRLF